MRLHLKIKNSKIKINYFKDQIKESLKIISQPKIIILEIILIELIVKKKKKTK